MSESEKDSKQQQFFLRSGKCWQGATHFVVWQVQPGVGGAKQLPKKFFLVVDCQQVNRSISLRLKKPENLRLQSGIAALIRKYLSSGVITEVLEHKKDGDLWIPFRRSSTQPATWFIRLSLDTPPALSLISSAGEDFFRFGQKGTFTRKKTFEGCLPGVENDGEYNNVLPQLLDALQQTPEGAEKPALVQPRESEELPFSAMQREARNKLARRAKTVKKAVLKQEASLPTQKEMDELQLKAQMLQSYAYLVKPNMVSLQLDSSYTGLEAILEIELDSAQSVGQNVEDYFIKLKKHRKAFELGSERLKKNRRDWQEMEADLEKLRSQALSEGEVTSLLKRYQLSLKYGAKDEKTKKPHDVLSSPYKVFLGEGGARFLVGKGPSENDALTRQAKSNDYWFHIIGVTGSHVVVPFKSLPHGSLNEKTKREAAILAVHYSKVRGDAAGEVYVTQRRHLRKQKGLPVGLWLVDKSESFFVRYQAEELQQILNRMQS